MRNKFVSLFIKKDLITESEEIKLGNLFISIVFLWIASGIALFFYKDRGTFGDMFGSINTLFSGLAFGGIIYTIYQQRAEFKLQREELILQRKEVAQTNNELREQVKSLKIQRFETSFFNMISLHNEIINSISEEGNSKTLQGRLIFPKMCVRFDTKFKSICKKIKEDPIIDEYQLGYGPYRLEILKKTCEEFYKIHGNLLEHYVRNVCTILRFIDNFDQFEERSKEKEHYMDILKAQLSYSELNLLFVTSFYYLGRELQTIGKKYNFFEHFDTSLKLGDYSYDETYDDLKWEIDETGKLQSTVGPI